MSLNFDKPRKGLSAVESTAEGSDAYVRITATDIVSVSLYASTIC